MLHLLPEEHKTNCGTVLTDREGSRGGDVGSQDERRPNPTKEPDLPLTTRQRGIQRGECMRSRRRNFGFGRCRGADAPSAHAGVFGRGKKERG